MKKILKTIIIIAVLLAPSFSILNLQNTVYAEDVCSTDGVADDVKRAAGCSGTNDQLPSVIQGILNAIIGIAGLVAVIYIIIGGVQYMTSSGDTTKVEKAKKTILYACIGLVICVLSFAIVNWAITAINNS